MRILEKRLAKLEGNNSPLSHLSIEELDARIDELLAKLGTTREEAIAQHGSLLAHARHLVSTDACLTAITRR